MGDAVIFDDGGSTRIKQLVGGTANGILDHLLEVSNPPGTQHSDDTAPGPFSQILIAFLDAAGGVTGTGPARVLQPIALAANHAFEIFSDNDQRVKGKVSAGADCQPRVV